MDRRLLTPKWVTAHLLVLALAIVFVRLGMWQLDRLEERREQNQIGESRFGEDPLPLDLLIESAGGDIGSLVYRPAAARGEFDRGNEVLIRSQVHLGNAGFHVITPLVQSDGTAVLVNRGWIPLILDEVPVAEGAPPEGVVTVTGWVEESEERPALGPEDPEAGRLSTLNRVDVDRIQQQVDYALYPVYLVELAEDDGELPVPVDEPTFTDQGPHLAYAIQWFGFASIGVIGYYFLARKRLRRSG